MKRDGLDASLAVSQKHMEVYVETLVYSERLHGDLNWLYTSVSKKYTNSCYWWLPTSSNHDTEFEIAMKGMFLFGK